MKNLWKKYKTRLFPQHKGSPPRHPAHAGYAILTLLATAAALWQHGEPRYTLILFALTVLCSFSLLIPYRFCNNLSRTILKIVLFGAGCFWCMHRLKAGVPSDKMLIETLALWNLTFLIGGRSRDYFYLLFNDLLLLLYAALIPRLFSLYMTIGALIVVIFILFANRSGYLSGDMLIVTPRGRLKRNWFHYAVYLLLAMVIFHHFFLQMPLMPGTQEGVVPVSFNTDKESFAPPGVKQWLKEGMNKKNGPDGKSAEDGIDGKFSLLSVNGKKLLPLKNPPPAAMSASGSGGGAMGKDLVFHVRSPLKLYHLAQLYDEYDGKIWRVSASFRNNRLREVPEDALAGRVKLSYTIEKWLSPKLFSPYLALDYELDITGRNYLTKRSFFGEEITTQLPGLPFRYAVNAEVRVSSGSLHEVPLAKDPAWRDRLSQLFYLRLPQQRISKRVKLLAKRITADCKSPYAKAVALRDFLRNNYRYKLHSEATPGNQESCDYFLFHLQEGHCEYFAAALAVLARLNQLPARVATGFSPGNYNTLTGEFEVFEYHAHAWTQIFIPRIGWLTFDATPPSAVVSDTTPLGFGKMRDPFGDEWRIQVPELTSHTIKHVQKILLAEKRRQQGEQSGMEETLNKIAQAGDELREQVQNHHEKQNLKQQKFKLNSGLIDLETVKEAVLSALKKIQSVALSAISYLMAKWYRILALPVLLILLGAAFRTGTALFRKLFRRIHFCILRKRAHHASPRIALRSCCHALLLLLEKYNMGRKNNQELLAYSHSLRADLAPHAEAIFKAFYRSEYRAGEPLAEEAQKAAKHLDELLRILPHN